VRFSFSAPRQPRLPSVAAADMAAVAADMAVAGEEWVVVAAGCRWAEEDSAEWALHGRLPDPDQWEHVALTAYRAGRSFTAHLVLSSRTAV